MATSNSCDVPSNVSNPIMCQSFFRRFVCRDATDELILTGKSVQNRTRAAFIFGLWYLISSRYGCYLLKRYQIFFSFCCAMTHLQQLSVGDIVYCSVSSPRNIAGVAVRLLSTHPPNVRIFHDLNAKVCQMSNEKQSKPHFPKRLFCEFAFSLQQQYLHELCILFVGFSAWIGTKTNYRSCGQYAIAPMQ